MKLAPQQNREHGMAEDFKTVIGTIQMMGNAKTTQQAKSYSVIEIEDKQGKIITLQDITVGNMLDNYLSLGNAVELKLVKAKIFSKLWGAASYIYGVKQNGKDVVGFVPAAFSTKRNINIIIGLLCFAGGITIPFGIYFIWKAFKQTRTLSRIKNEIT